MSPATIVLLNLGIIAGIMVLLWLISVRLRDASIVDIFWGIGFVVVAWVAYLVVDMPSPRGMLICVLTSMWGLRLAAYLAWRNLGKGEDRRYQAMRERAGDRFPLVSLFTVFGLQGVIMWVVSVPVQVAGFQVTPLGWLDALGTGIWTLGWLCESLGDLQLARFKAKPENRGKVLDRGLWRYTRHPNYFGDFLVWWGIYLIAAGGGAWWSVFSPLLMSVLLMRVSGVTLLESSLKKTRPDYEDYVARTSAFFPWPPRQAS
jgi:steroid 5-alpha reductase family enzyme